MFRGEIVHVSAGPVRHHVVAAVVATALSLAIHVVLLILLPWFRIAIPTVTTSYRVQPEYRSLQLRDVETPEEVALSDLSRVDEPRTTVDLAEVVKELGLQPEEVVIEPPPVTDERLAGEGEPITLAEPQAERDLWEPRQEILEIDTRIAATEIFELDRFSIPKIERVREAPDIVIPVERELANVSEPDVRLDRTDMRPAASDMRVQGAGLGAVTRPVDAEVVIGEPAAETAGSLLTERPTEITAYKPIEDLLRAKVVTFTTLRDFRHGYFRIEIERAGPQILPVIPKDVVFVQDNSASMGEQRMYFCRQGLIAGLSELGAADRFNVVGFSDRADYCFPTWTNNTPEARQAATRFIERLAVGGNTDIFTSMKNLLARLEQKPGRPVVAMLISDGVPTRGVIDSSDIIAEFSKLNGGRMSVFSMGTAQTANTYLLDLVSYCNRGDAALVKGGRWGLPEEMRSRVRSVGRPVLSDMRFQFAGDESVEVYPRLTSNLYLDKALVLYGRYSRGTKDVTFQVVGQALETKCDMIFNLALDDKTASGEKDIREMWARQKLYHLIAEYARTPTQGILDEIQQTARAYDVRIPHRGSF